VQPFSFTVLRRRGVCCPMGELSKTGRELSVQNETTCAGYASAKHSTFTALTTIFISSRITGGTVYESSPTVALIASSGRSPHDPLTRRG